MYGLKSQDQLELKSAKPLMPLMSVEAKLRSVHYAQQGRLLGECHTSSVISCLFLGNGVSAHNSDGPTLSRDSVVGTITVGWLEGYPTPIKNTLNLNASTDGRVVCLLYFSSSLLSLKARLYLTPHEAGSASVRS